MNRILACLVTFLGIMLCNVATAETTTTHVDEHSVTVVKPLKPAAPSKKKVKAKKEAKARKLKKATTLVDEQHTDSHSTTVVVPAH